MRTLVVLLLVLLACQPSPEARAGREARYQKALRDSLAAQEKAVRDSQVNSADEWDRQADSFYKHQK